MNCNICQTHCENCGSTDYEDVDRFANHGYSTCCNELIVANNDECRGFHGE